MIALLFYVCYILVVQDDFKQEEPEGASTLQARQAERQDARA